eukprot:TRINITY_DN413_c0_g1_i2.p1 TRINITY_DN413_c0_g1~~TRINITY_DN413_c0_g1_i2.p1  ORF type:complete len:709 (-),score=252.45 TRINITY_DN413_c0_g1_i2:133-2259(-)
MPAHSARIMARFFVLLCLVGMASASQESMAGANPIRKVVTLMETMQSKIEAEAKKEDELFERFECYCKKTKAQLQDAIAKAEMSGNIKPEDIKAKEARLQALEQEVEDLKNEKIDEEKSLASAKAARDKVHNQLVKDEKEQVETENAAEGAIKTLGSNETDPDKQLEHRVVKNPGLFLSQLAEERKGPSVFNQKLTAFLQEQGGPGASTGEVTAYIKNIEEESEERWRQDVAEDTEDAKQYAALKGSKQKSVKTVLEQITRKAKKIGDLKVEIVNMKHMMKDGGKALAENQKMLAELEKDCAQRAGEQEEKKVIRAEEEKALQDTIKMLNDDDALDLFRKTIKKPSFLQLDTAREQAVEQAKQIVNTLRSSGNRPQLSLIALALTGKKVDFTKVFKKIDGMVTLLGKEGKDDASKKEYCNKEFDEVKDKTKDLKTKISEIAASLEEKQASIEQVAQAIKEINEGVQSLDESVATATENRKAESADYQELVQQDSAAVELLGMAKDRLNQFYNPMLAKVTTTKSPYDPYALVQVSLHQQQPEAMESPIQEVEVGTPPPTAGAYKTKSGASNGVLSMITTMISDLEKEMLVAKTEEANSQKEYETLVADAKEKRQEDLKDAQHKAQVKADLEHDSEEDGQEKAATEKEQQAAMVYTEDLHKECDWILANFDIRLQARGEEIESLKRAKAVLAGADYSLLQVASVRRLRGH